MNSGSSSNIVVVGWVTVVSIVVGLVYCMGEFIYTYVWIPARITKVMRLQGIMGPTPQVLFGNLSEMATLRSHAAALSTTPQPISALSTTPQPISHDIVPRLMPDYKLWSQIYGERYLYWWGVEPRLAISDPRIIKEFLSSKYAMNTGRSALQQWGVKNFIGAGLLMVNGDTWSKQRRMVAPAFHHQKLKAQMEVMVDCVREMLEGWEAKKVTEMEVSDRMSRLTGDIIARVGFGSTYKEAGTKIFQQLRDLQKLSSASNSLTTFFLSRLPLLRLVPTKRNRQIWRLKNEVETWLGNLIVARRNLAPLEGYGDDLLGIMLEEMDKMDKMDMALSSSSCDLQNAQQLMDECKTFFFAGHDTTSMLLTWTLMLLGSNPEWQERAREEVLRVCQGGRPHYDDLSKLKVVRMVLNESLRLYTPASLLARQAFSDMHIGDVFIPKGLSIWIPVLAMHHEKKYWGSDANEFNPNRFANEDNGSISCSSCSKDHVKANGGQSHITNRNAACQTPSTTSNPCSCFRITGSESSTHTDTLTNNLPEGHQQKTRSGFFLPFSHGPRNCIGQGFAMMEAKVVLSMILSRYRFSLAPSYQHAPILVLTLKPKHGVPLILQKLN